MYNMSVKKSPEPKSKGQPDPASQRSSMTERALGALLEIQVDTFHPDPALPKVARPTASPAAAKTANPPIAAKTTARANTAKTPTKKAKPKKRRK
jgi:hypothetical protein